MRRMGIAWALAGALLAGHGSAAWAGPIQTASFPGGLEITDDAGGTSFDVNGDGQLDVNVAYFGISVNSIFAWDGVVRSHSGAGAEILGAFDANSEAVADFFNAGQMINPAASTIPSNIATKLGYEVFQAGESGGAWLNVSGPVRGFAGFTFDISGGTHAGWIDLELDNLDDNGAGSVFVHGYGYETAANTAIAAGVPEPASIAILATGSLLLLRRRDRPAP